MRTLWRSMSSHRRELAGAGILGAIASLSAVALLGTSAWLISTAAEMPPVLTLTVAAVMVRFLALSRALFRYAERLVGHDAAFRGLTELRVVVYSSLERLAPTGLSAFGRGDLLARLVADVDAALDLPLRVVLPWAQAVLVAAATVVFLGVAAARGGCRHRGAVRRRAGRHALAGGPHWRARPRIGWRRRRPSCRAPSSAHSTAHAEITAFGAGAAAATRIHDLDDEPHPPERPRVLLPRLRRRHRRARAGGRGRRRPRRSPIPAVTSGRIEPVMLAVVALLPLALFDVLSGLPASALAYQRLRGSAVRIQEVETRRPCRRSRRHRWRCPTAVHRARP